MDFYYVDKPFKGVQMQKPLPYFKSRATDASIDWQFCREDLVRGGLSLGRNIWNLRTHVNIGYGRYQNSQTGNNGGNGVVTIPAGNLVSSGVRPGDRFINYTRDEANNVESVDSTTQLTLTDTTAQMDDLDEFSILLSEPQWSGASGSSTDYWTVTYKEVRMEMDLTQANQYKAQIQALYADAVQQQAFVLGAPTIRDGNRAKWPLWRPLMGDSFYFRINDLFPEAALFSTSDDRKQAFLAVSMDYQYRSNRLRIVPSTNDSRLDAILNQAGLINGWLIGTEEREKRRSMIGAEEGGDRGGGGGSAWGNPFDQETDAWAWGAWEVAHRGAPEGDAYSRGEWRNPPAPNPFPNTGSGRPPRS